MGKHRRPSPSIELARGAGRAAGVTILLAGVTGGAGLAAGSPAHAAVGPKRIMIAGDSMAEGSAGDYTWRYRLAQHLWQSAPGATDLVGDRTDVYDNVTNTQGSQAYLDPWFDRDHHSAWGRMISQEKDTIQGALAATPADILLLELGENDLVYASTPQQAAANLKLLIDNARKANPNITVVMGHVLTKADANGNLQLVSQAAAFNQILDANAAAWSTPSSKVVVARPDLGWDPRTMTWDGTHPNPTGEVYIARGYGDALADLGIGSHSGALGGPIAWPAMGQTPVTVSQPGKIALTWAATPGATAYFIEQRVISYGEFTFTRLPYPIIGATSWTTGPLPAGLIVDYRIVPVKGNMVGQPGWSSAGTAGSTTTSAGSAVVQSGGTRALLNVL